MRVRVRMLACAASPGSALSIPLSCTMRSPMASVFGLKPSARKPWAALAHVRILRGGCRRAVSGER